MTARDHERIDELLAQHAIEGLSSEERAELRELGVNEAELEEMELAAAAAHVGLLGDAEPLPAGLRAKVLEQGGERLKMVPGQGAQANGRKGDARAGGSGSGSFGMLAGWMAAAAAVVLAVLAWWPATQPVAPVLSAAAQREALLARADVVRGNWGDWGEDPAVGGVAGDVVWSPGLQEGYMRFRGLAPNDPTAEQYQLWIVDAARGEPLQVPPVDGGVFDVAATGEVIIPISAKLPVGEAVAFAITVEPPGGVVVSDQSRRVVVAMVGP